ALDLLWISDSRQGRGHHIAMLEGADKPVAFLWIMAQPVQEFGESPLVWIRASAPVNGGQLFTVCGFGDLGGFVLGAMITPEVVLAQRLHAFAAGDHA